MFLRLTDTSGLYRQGAYLDCVVEDGGVWIRPAAENEHVPDMGITAYDDMTRLGPRDVDLLIAFLQTARADYNLTEVPDDVA